MNTLNKNSLEFIKSELKKSQIEVVPKENGREGVNSIIKTKTGNLHEVYLQPINLTKERSVNLPAGRQES